MKTLRTMNKILEKKHRYLALCLKYYNDEGFLFYFQDDLKTLEYFFGSYKVIGKYYINDLTFYNK